MNRCFVLALILAAGCSQKAPPPANSSETPQPPTNTTAETPLSPPGPGEPGGLPDDRTPVAEGPIDSKSGQGAAQVLQSYFALLETGKTAEADKLWSDSGTPQDFAAMSW